MPVTIRGSATSEDPCECCDNSPCDAPTLCGEPITPSLRARFHDWSGSPGVTWVNDLIVPVTRYSAVAAACTQWWEFHHSRVELDPSPRPGIADTILHVAGVTLTAYPGANDTLDVACAGGGVPFAGFNPVVEVRRGYSRANGLLTLARGDVCTAAGPSPDLPDFYGDQIYGPLTVVSLDCDEEDGFTGVTFQFDGSNSDLTISGRVTIEPDDGSTPLTVRAEADVTTGCAPLDVVLTATANGGTPSYGYAWYRSGSPATPFSTSNPAAATVAAAGESFWVVVTDSDSPVATATSNVVGVSPRPLLWYCDPSVGSCSQSCTPIDPASPAGWTTEAGCLANCGGPGCPTVAAEMSLSGTPSTNPAWSGVYCSELSVSFTVTVTGGTPPYTVTVDFADDNPEVQVGNGPTFTFSHTYATTSEDPVGYTPTAAVNDSGGCSLETVLFSGGSGGVLGGGFGFGLVACAECPTCDPSTWSLSIQFVGPCGTVTGTYTDPSGIMSDGSQVTASCAGGTWTIGIDGSGCLPGGTYTGSATGAFPTVFTSGGYTVTLGADPCP